MNPTGKIFWRASTDCRICLRSWCCCCYRQRASEFLILGACSPSRNTHNIGRLRSGGRGAVRLDLLIQRAIQRRAPRLSYGTKGGVTATEAGSLASTVIVFSAAPPAG